MKERPKETEALTAIVVIFAGKNFSVAGLILENAVCSEKIEMQ